MRHPTKKDSFAKLKQMGVPVGTVLDVGVQTCTKELMEAFRDKKHILMEPVAEFEPTMRKLYGNARIDHEILILAVSDSDGEVAVKTSSVRADQPITHARMTDEVGDGQNFRTVPMRKLDSIVAERALEKPYLLKVDIDGAEMSVLAGAQEMLPDCSIVCIEAGIKNFHERTRAIMSAGFQAFDIVDLCYYDDRLVQTDMLFLNTRIVKDYDLHLFKDGLDIQKWMSYRPDDCQLRNVANQSKRGIS